jgi:medium-chain acyl-[acyl-carrier-protein] hydrolase
VAEWLRFFPSRRPRPQVVLACVPPAGAGASAFAAWPGSLPAWVDLCAVAVPGREARLGEPAARSIAEIAEPVAAEIARLGLPVAVLGHSLGAWIGLEVVRLLRAAAVPVVRFFPAAARPPHAGDRPAIGCDPAALIAYLRDLGGTPEDVLRDRELLELVLPALRADLAVAAAHPARIAPVDVPSTVLCGADDRGLPVALAARWRELAGECEQLVFPGGHFFLHASRDAVLAALLRPGRLRPSRPGPRACSCDPAG